MATTRFRAGDVERDATAARLREAHAAGRLTLAEFDSRVGDALGATYLDELPALVADLPVERAAPEAASAPRREGQRSWPPPWLLVIAVVSLVLVVTGHPPFPLLWLAVFLLWRRGFGGWPRRFTARATDGPARTA